MGYVPLWKRPHRALSTLVHIVRMSQEDVRCESEGSSPHHAGCPDLGLVVSGTVRNKTFIVYKASSPWYFVKHPEQTKSTRVVPHCLCGEVTSTLLVPIPPV